MSLPSSSTLFKWSIKDLRFRLLLTYFPNIFGFCLHWSAISRWSSLTCFCISLLTTLRAALYFFNILSSRVAKYDVRFQISQIFAYFSPTNSPNKYDADVTPRVIRVCGSTTMILGYRGMHFIGRWRLTRGNVFKLDKSRAKYDSMLFQKHYLISYKSY